MNFFSIFQSLSHLFQFAENDLCRQISLELISWWPHSSLERERKFCRRLFASSRKRKIIHYFHVVVVQERQRNVQKSVIARANVSRPNKHPCAGQGFVVLNCQRSRYADWWIWIDAHTSNAFGWDFCTGHVEKAGLATSGSLFSRNFGRIELSFGWGMDTYLVDREPVFSR